MSQLNNQKTTLVKQLYFVAMCLGVGVLMQILLFKTKQNSYIDALLAHQWLWVIYYFVSFFLIKKISK